MIAQEWTCWWLWTTPGLDGTRCSGWHSTRSSWLGACGARRVEASRLWSQTLLHSGNYCTYQLLFWVGHALRYLCIKITVCKLAGSFSALAPFWIPCTASSAPSSMGIPTWRLSLPWSGKVKFNVAVYIRFVIVAYFSITAQCTCCSWKPL